VVHTPAVLAPSWSALELQNLKPHSDLLRECALWHESWLLCTYVKVREVLLSFKQHSPCMPADGTLLLRQPSWSCASPAAASAMTIKWHMVAESQDGLRFKYLAFCCDHELSILDHQHVCLSLQCLLHLLYFCAMYLSLSNTKAHTLSACSAEFLTSITSVEIYSSAWFLPPCPRPQDICTWAWGGGSPGLFFRMLG
jgi:hypothetical protein